MDANIWIDLDNGGLLDLFFGLPFEVVTPDVVIAELDGDTETTVTQRCSEILSAGAETYEFFAELRSRYPAPSDADLFTLLHAKQGSLRLLSGDAHLRKAAQAEGVRVSGLLWLLDRIFEHGLAGGEVLSAALEKMIARNARLPARECRRRLRRWRKK